MFEKLENMSHFQLTAIRSTLLRGVASPKYSTEDEREGWRVQVDAITAELTRRNELKL